MWLQRLTCFPHCPSQKNWQTLDLEQLTKTWLSLRSTAVSGKKISNILYVVGHPFYKGKTD